MRWSNDPPRPCLNHHHNGLRHVDGIMYAINQQGIEVLGAYIEVQAGWRVNILLQANDVINGARANDYGDAKENFTRIASRWSQVLGVDVTPEQVVLCMIDLKVARLCNSINHQDTWLDIAGYVGVFGKLSETTKAVAQPIAEPKKKSKTVSKQNSFGAEIKEFCKQSNIPASELGRRIGIHPTTMQKYARGVMNPSAERKAKIRKAMSLSNQVKEIRKESRSISFDSETHYFSQEEAYKLLEDKANGIDVPKTWEIIELIGKCDQKINDIKNGKGDRVWDSLKNGVMCIRPAVESLEVVS